MASDAADFVIVSAGDDEAVGISLLRLSPHASDVPPLAPRTARGTAVELRALGTKPGAHSAAIRGVAALGSVVVTAGCDQRLNAWRWDVPLLGAAIARAHGDSDAPDVPVAASWPLRLCASRTTSVQDVHGLCVCAQQGAADQVAPSQAGEAARQQGESAAAGARELTAHKEAVAVAVVGDGVEVVAFEI